MRLIRLTLLMALAPLSAQQAPAPQGVVFKSESNLVIETIAVKDKEGRPIEGLTAKDFTITENGVPQTIRFCDFQKLEVTAQPPKPVAAAPKPVSTKVVSVTGNQIAA